MVRYGLLMLVTVLQLLWILSGPENPTVYMIGMICLATLMLVASYFAKKQKMARWTQLTGVLVVAACVGGAVIFLSGEAAQALTFISVLLVAMITPYFIVSGLMHRRQVDLQLLFGAITFYLLMGLVFATLYALLDIISTDALFVHNSELINGSFRDQTYFSFITLSTTGYGDYTPSSGAVRSLAILEAISGQLYLVIALATIVSLLGRKHLAEEET